MNKVIEDYLTCFDLKKNLNEDLLSNISLIEFNKDEYICRINKSLKYFYFLVDGKAKITTLVANGKSLLISFATPLSVIGDIEFLNMSLADCDVITLEKCTCLAIPLQVVNEFASNDPKFLRFVINMLETKLRNNSNFSSINLLYPLENRFASYLLSVFSKEFSNSNIIEIDNLTHVAELLGTSYRHLTRVIKKLTDEQIIKKNKRLIEIIDLQKLEALNTDIFTI